MKAVFGTTFFRGNVCVYVCVCVCVCVGLKQCWNVDIILGWLLNDDAWLERGRGGQNLGKSDYIISECS